MQMKHGLPGPGACVDHDTVIGQAFLRSNSGDEVEHPLVLAGVELGDFVEARDVVLGDHEQMSRRLRVNVPDGDEPLGRRHVIAVGVERTEEAALVRQRESPPR